MTIREIAEAAGVSTATVSRAINKNGFVSKKALDRINRAINSNGQSMPNLQRKSMSVGRLSNRSFAMFWMTELKNANSGSGQKIMLGMTEALRPLKTDLIVDYMDGDSDRIPDCLRKQSIDGVFLFGNLMTDKLQETLRGIPCVWFYHAGQLSEFDCVTPDHARAGTLAFDYLRSKGCRRFCCIDVQRKTDPENYANSRIDGFVLTAKRSGIDCEHITMVQERDAAAELARVAKESVEAFMKITPRPDGLFVASSKLSIYIHSELKMRGIIPMHDIQMVCGDIDTCGGLMDPEPVMFNIDPQTIGELAIEAMLWRMSHPQVKKITRMLSPDLIIPE